MTHLGSAGSPPEGFLQRRLVLAAVIALVVWAVLIGRLFYLQVLQEDRYRISAERNSVRTRRVEAPRGMILDRSGVVLVDSRPSFDVAIVPSEVDDMDAALRRIAALTGRELETVHDAARTSSAGGRFAERLVARDLDRATLARVEERLWALGGVTTRATPVRAYRQGDVLAHVLGWLGEIDASQLERRDYQGYRRGEIIGKDGIEKLLDRDLRGRPGGRNVLVDAHGRELETLGAIEPQPGHNVVLTIDERLQEAAARALDAIGRGGAVVALDPRTGEVLVLLSRPSFDPNRFVSGLDRKEWNALVNHPRTPLHNRAIRGQYPPGSTYKVVTALAGLEEKVITANTKVFCGGAYTFGRRRYRCWKKEGHGSVDVHRALVESCDVFFYQTGRQLGVDRLAYYGRALGLGQPTGIDLEGERGGLVPTAAWKLRRFGERWMDGETISLSIGQGFNLWTPLQLASVYATIGKGGQRYRPYLVQRVEDASGKKLRETQPELLGEIAIGARSLEIVRDALHGVVHEPRGTGSAMRRPPLGVEAAGKTGTAQVVAMAADGSAKEDEIREEHRDHAWFATYAPAEDPRIAVAVLVEHGGHGGSAAAPIARAVVEAFLVAEREDSRPTLRDATGGDAVPRDGVGSPAAPVDPQRVSMPVEVSDAD